MSREGVQVGRHTYGHEKIAVLRWDASADLSIGSFCSIAYGCTVFLGGDHRVDWVTTYPFTKLDKRWPGAAGIGGHPATKGDVTIGNDVWIAAEAAIMSGVTVGDGAVIAARSTVVKDVPPYTIVGGNPARVVGHRFEPHQVEALMAIRWWEWPDERIAANVELLCSDDIDRFIAANPPAAPDGRATGPDRHR